MNAFRVIQASPVPVVYIMIQRQVLISTNNARAYAHGLSSFVSPSPLPPLLLSRAQKCAPHNLKLRSIGEDIGRALNQRSPRVVTKVNLGMSDGLGARLGRLFFPNSSSTEYPSFSTVPVSLEQQSTEEQETRTTPETRGDADPMTTLFLSHGSPMLPIQYDDPARQFISELPTQIERPKAIVIISAHWDTTEPTVTAVRKNDTIHDFYGFPRELYKLRYDAPGHPELAQRVLDLLKQGGFPNARKDEKRGLDHGAWVPLLIMYPNADIPVVQLSVQYRKNGAHHYKVGQAIASLKNEGVLIIGSGSATHNLGALNFDGGPVVPWALAFDNWLNDVLVNKRHEDVINYTEKAPYARKAHPTPDHFLPAIVAIGAAGQESDGERIHNGFVLGTVSMASFAFKTPAMVAASA